MLCSTIPLREMRMGPCFSFKGIDNNIYYMLTPDGHYYNFSGCGNVMNCNHPDRAQLYHRLSATTGRLSTAWTASGSTWLRFLSRDQNGAPMARSADSCSRWHVTRYLDKMKLIAEAWDAGGLYQVGSFPSWSRWAEWNGRYRDDMRRFLKGDGEHGGNRDQHASPVRRDLYDPVQQR